MARRGWSKGSSVMGSSGRGDGGADPLVRSRRPRRPACALQDADTTVPAAGPGGPPHHFCRTGKLEKGEQHYLHCPLAMVHFSPATKFSFGEGYPKTSS